MTYLTRYDPFRERYAWRNAMDRMFNNSIVTRIEDWQPIRWELALDVSETDDEFLVKASLPGINPEDLDIIFDNNVLSIKGEFKEEKDIEEKRYHLRERRYGTFSRSISIPSSVKTSKIEASYDAGVLTLHLPKAEEAKSKRIPVHSTAVPKMINSTVQDIASKS